MLLCIGRDWVVNAGGSPVDLILPNELTRRLLFQQGLYIFLQVLAKLARTLELIFPPWAI